jgi:hypothetical protein
MLLHIEPDAPLPTQTGIRLILEALRLHASVSDTVHRACVGLWSLASNCGSRSRCR